MTQRALDQSLMSTGKEAVEWLQKNRVAVQEGGRGIKGWASRYRRQVKEAVRVWKERKIANGDEWDAIIIDVGGVSIPSDLFEHWFPEAERPRAESPRAESPRAESPRAEAGTKEVDENPNSEPQSPILGSQQVQYQISDEMQFFLGIPKKVSSGCTGRRIAQP